MPRTKKRKAVPKKGDVVSFPVGVEGVETRLGILIGPRSADQGTVGNLQLILAFGEEGTKQIWLEMAKRIGLVYDNPTIEGLRVAMRAATYDPLISYDHKVMAEEALNLALLIPLQPTLL